MAAADTAADAAVGSSGFVLDKGLEVGTGELCSCPPLPTPCSRTGRRQGSRRGLCRAFLRRPARRQAPSRELRCGAVVAAVVETGVQAAGALGGTGESLLKAVGSGLEVLVSIPFALLGGL